MGMSQMKKKSTQFQPGQSGNPKGRPKGAKNRLSEDFLSELAKVFREKGGEAIEIMCAEHPADFIRCIAGLVPKELLLEISTEEKTNWVINARPRLDEKAWRKLHKLEIPIIEGEKI